MMKRKLLVLCIPLFVVAFSVLFMFVSHPITTIDFTALHWEKNASPIILTGVSQQNEEGLLAIRRSDGLPAFIPGDWSVSFNAPYAFAFSGATLLALSPDTIVRLELDDKETQIESVALDRTTGRLAIVGRKGTSSRICFTNIAEKTFPPCQTLDINKETEVAWSPNAAIVKTLDGLLYRYLVEEAKMRVIDSEKEPEEHTAFRELFQRVETNSPTILTFLGIVWLQGQDGTNIYRTGKKLQHVFWFDEDHLMLQQKKNTFFLLELSTGNLAAVPHVEQMKELTAQVPKIKMSLPSQ